MFELRPYQTEAIGLAYQRAEEGHRPIICAPCGSGKTVIAGQMAKDAMEQGKTVLWMTGREEILRQAYRTFSDMCGIRNVGVLCAGLANEAPWWFYPKVTVASWDTLKARWHKSDAWKIPADVILIDEAHLSLSEKMRRTVLPYYEGKEVTGFTATPARKSGKGLGTYYSRIIQVRSVQQIIDEGHLAACEYWAGSHADTSRIAHDHKTGDFKARELGAAHRDGVLIGDVVDNWLRLASDRHTIVFAVDIAHAQALTERFQAAGIAAEVIHSKLPHGTREQISEQFRRGIFQVLINVGIATYGYDVPEVNCVVIARPTKSIVLWHQMCLDMETEILTDAGWKRCDELTDSDRCAGFDMQTEQIEWCEIEEKIDRRMVPGETMYGYDGHNAMLRITDQHDMVIKARRAKAWLKEPAAQAAARRDMSYIPVAGMMDIPEAQITDDELRFVGWVLTDGSVTRGATQVVIAQSSKHEAYCEEIERVLTACGFRWGRSALRRYGNEFGLARDYPECYQYRISVGKPRRIVDRHLRGCAYLLPWLDKSMPAIFDSLSERQFGVLIEAMFLGDGKKYAKADYVPATLEITCGDNERMADRLQALAVVRGWRCNKSEHFYNARPLYNLRLRQRRYITIAGKNVRDGSVGNKKRYKRARLSPVPFDAGERVWCVRNRLGTIVTRRNGKVAIVGNCGRGMRPKGGDHCMVLDHGDNVRRLGCIEDEIRWRLDEGREAAANTTREGDPSRNKKPEAPATECDNCHHIFARSRICPKCGWEKPVRSQDVETIEADLVKVRKAKVDNNQDGWPDEKTFYLMLKYHAQSHGYSIGWAAWKYKEKHSKWPGGTWKSMPGIPPSARVANWIRSKQIAWVKSRKPEPPEARL